MTLTKYPASRTRMQNKAQMAGYTHLRMHCRYWPTKKDREWNKCELKFGSWRFNPTQGKPDRKIGKLIITASEQIEMIPWKLFWFFHQRRGDFFSHNIFLILEDSHCLKLSSPSPGLCFLAGVCLKQRCGESWLRLTCQLLSPPLVIKFREFTWNFHNAPHPAELILYI